MDIRKGTVNKQTVLGGLKMENRALREMNIEEYCAQLPEDHLVNQELKRLLHRVKHPIRWWIWQKLTSIKMVDYWFDLKEPIVRDELKQKGGKKQ